MRRSVLLRLAAPLVGALVLLPACSGDDTPSSSTTATANPVSDDTLDPSDPLAYATFGLPAAPQCVALGRRFAIELDAEPSAGRQWRVVAPPVGPTATSTVVIGGTEFVGAPGSDTEHQRITFAASSLSPDWEQARGQVDVTLQYVGADGAPIPDVAEETWAITVTPDGNCPAPPVSETTIASNG